MDWVMPVIVAAAELLCGMGVFGVLERNWIGLDWVSRDGERSRMVSVEGADLT